MKKLIESSKNLSEYKKAPKWKLFVSHKYWKIILNWVCLFIKGAVCFLGCWNFCLEMQKRQSFLCLLIGAYSELCCAKTSLFWRHLNSHFVEVLCSIIAVFKRSFVLLCFDHCCRNWIWLIDNHNNNTFATRTNLPRATEVFLGGEIFV